MPRPLRSGRKPTLYDTNHVTSKAKAERALYDRLRDETDLTANLVQKGIRRAVEAVKSGVGRLKRGENTSQPHFSADSAVYDKRSATFHRTTFLFRPSKPCKLTRATRRNDVRRVGLLTTTIGQESRSGVRSAGTRTTPSTTRRRTSVCSISVVPRNRRFLVCERDAERLVNVGKMQTMEAHP